MLSRPVVATVVAFAGIVALVVGIAAQALPADDGPAASLPAGGSSQAAGTPAPTTVPVTMEDRRLALGQAAVCVQKAGFEVTVHYGAGLRIGGLELKVPDADGAPDAETSREADEIVRQCLRTHYEPVGERWNAQQTEPSTADVDALSRRLEQCVANGGVPGIESNFGVQYVEYANPASTPVFIEPEDLPQYTECAIQEERETGLKAPYPWPGYSIEDALKYDSRPRGASD